MKRTAHIIHLSLIGALALVASACGTTGYAHTGPAYETVVVEEAQPRPVHKTVVVKERSPRPVHKTVVVEKEVVVKHAPPPRPRPVKVIVKKRPGYVWVPGHWEYSRHARRYVWVRGHYKPKRKGYAGYSAGHWRKTPRGWVWVKPRWRR